MFSKSSKAPAAAPPPAPRPVSATGVKHTPFSLIGGDVVISGNVEASVDLHIDGRVDGDVSCANLVQGPDSSVHGAITARAARLAGEVNGAVTADTLVIEASARIMVMLLTAH